jgi:NAD-dependent dihydropyrimidine dehydrogenase PreA subunit
MNDNQTPITINEQFCNGCGRCVFVCSMGVIEMRNKPGSENEKTASVAKPEFCMYCEACVIDCKRGAISLNPLYGSFNMDKISDLILKKKKSRFKFWGKKS